jgi:hypothetical protein
MRYAATLVVLGTVSRATGQVAITEFLNNPDGTDKGREWVEMFNFSPRAVSLAGWTLEDEGTDAFALPAIDLPPGGYLLVACGAIGDVDAATAKAIVETEWFGGRARRFVIGADDLVLSNGADELVLRNPCGETAWCLAWINDETPRFATYLTEGSGFAVSAFGTKEIPGVVRHGSDNGIEGFPGYEEGDQSRDAFAVESDISGLVAGFGRDFANVDRPSVGSPLRGGDAALAPGDVDADGRVDGNDLTAVLLAWGRCAACGCAADIDGDGAVGVVDFLLLLWSWEE